MTTTARTVDPFGRRRRPVRPAATARVKPTLVADCPRCGFHFPKPQAHCNSEKACAARAAIRNGEPVPEKEKPSTNHPASQGMSVAPGIVAANEKAAKARTVKEKAVAHAEAAKKSVTPRPKKATANGTKAASIAARKAAANIVG